MGTGEFSISRDGSLFYAPGLPMGVGYRIVWVDRDGTVAPLLEETRSFYQIELSPGGNLLAVTTNDANMSLWLYDIGRGALSRLVSGFNNWDPVWTPSGDHLAFSSDREGTFSVFSTDALGGRGTRRLIGGETEQRARSWTPDGRTLAFDEHGAETGWDIWLFSGEGETSRRPFVRTSASEQYPAFSPDGRWMAYQSDESGRREIYIVPFPEGEPKRLVSIEGGEQVRWNPNGRELFFRNGNRMMVVGAEFARSLVLTKPRLLFESESFQSRGNSYDVSADGERFIMIDRSRSAQPPTQLVVVQNLAEELKRLVPTDQ